MDKNLQSFSDYAALLENQALLNSYAAGVLVCLANDAQYFLADPLWYLGYWLVSYHWGVVGRGQLSNLNLHLQVSIFLHQ